MKDTYSHILLPEAKVLRFNPANLSCNPRLAGSGYEVWQDGEMVQRYMIYSRKNEPFTQEEIDYATELGGLHFTDAQQLEDWLEQQGQKSKDGWVTRALKFIGL